MSFHGEARVEEEVRLGVLAEVGGHRAHDRQPVGAGRDLGEHVRDLQAALAVPGELEGRGEDIAVVVEDRPGNLHRERLAGFLRESGLGIEGVDVGDAAGHEAEDDLLHPGDDARRSVKVGSSARGPGGLRQGSTQGNEPEARGGTGEQVSSGGSRGVDQVLGPLRLLAKVTELLHEEECVGKLAPGTAFTSVKRGLQLFSADTGPIACPLQVRELL